MAEEQSLGFFEKYLTIWVGLCLAAGLLLGQYFPEFAGVFRDDAYTYAGVEIPIAIMLFLMIYPIMVQIDFRKIIEAGKSGKPIGLTLFLNWAVKPFTMAFIAWLFFIVIYANLGWVPVDIGQEFMSGMILLGIAPCTAMVLVWGYLSRGNMGHTLVMVAINSISMLIFYAPLAVLLLGVSDLPVPWQDVAFGVGLYVGLPLVLGYITRKMLLDKKGTEWFEGFTENLHYASIIALLLTIIVIISPQADVILTQPHYVLLILIPLIVQIMMIFGIGYYAAKHIGLSYEDAAPSAQIAASNNFEVAIAMSITLRHVLGEGATLAAVTGMLIEVPLMLILVRICLKTQHWFPKIRKDEEPIETPS